MAQNKKMNRRKFLSSTAATVAFTVVPRHVLGGLNYVAPSDKITLGYIGCGTQGIREMVRLITPGNTDSSCLRSEQIHHRLCGLVNPWYSERNP